MIKILTSKHIVRCSKIFVQYFIDFYFNNVAVLFLVYALIWITYNLLYYRSLMWLWRWSGNLCDIYVIYGATKIIISSLLAQFYIKSFQSEKKTTCSIMQMLQLQRI